MKLGLLKLKRGQYRGNVFTATGALEIEYENTSTEDDKVVATVSTGGPQSRVTIPNERERPESANGEQVTCDALVEKCVTSERPVDLGRV